MLGLETGIIIEFCGVQSRNIGADTLHAPKILLGCAIKKEGTNDESMKKAQISWDSVPKMLI